MTSDTGNTLRDADSREGCPTVRRLYGHSHYVDTANNVSASILASSTFSEYEGGRIYYAIIKSWMAALPGRREWSFRCSRERVARLHMTFASEIELEPVGFLSSSKGLLVSTDRGSTWTLRDTISCARSEMVSLTQGVGLRSTVIYSTAIRATTGRRVQTSRPPPKPTCRLNGFSSTELSCPISPIDPALPGLDQTATSGSAAAWGSTARTGVPARSMVTDTG